jgi:hypothetical protein
MGSRRERKLGGAKDTQRDNRCPTSTGPHIKADQTLYRFTNGIDVVFTGRGVVGEPGVRPRE